MLSMANKKALRIACLITTYATIAGLSKTMWILLLEPLLPLAWIGGSAVVSVTHNAENHIVGFLASIFILSYLLIYGWEAMKTKLPPLINFKYSTIRVLIIVVVIIAVIYLSFSGRQ